MDTNSPQETREASPPEATGFDEQLWPVNLVILILAGFLVGVICAQGSFNVAEAGFFGNSYIHLGIVTLLVGVLLWAVTWLNGATVRRVQLCVLFSLLVHLGLAVYLHGQYLALAAAAESAEAFAAAYTPERITVPDYQFQFPDRPRTVESFERPVETEVPDGLGIKPIERHPTEQEAAVERPKTLEPETPPEHPDPADLRRAELSPPEREEETAERIRRQASSQRPEPQEEVALPEIPRANAVDLPLPIEIDPETAPAERRAEAPELVRDVRDPTRLPMEIVTPLPASKAPRRLASEEPLPELDPPAPTPTTLARADRAVELPSATMTAEDVTAPPTLGGGVPSSVEMISAAAPVQRSEKLALSGPTTAAAGAAEFAMGSARVPARVGQPRAAGSSRPSIDPDAYRKRIARAPTGLPVPTTLPPQLAQVPVEAAADGGAGPAVPSPEARATPVGWAGSVGIPTPLRTSLAGSGPARLSGMSGLAPEARLARIPGQAALPSAQAGGGSPMPARRLGRAISSGATVEVPHVAAGPPRGGAAAGPKLEVQPSGQAQQVFGLPGSLQTQPRVGAPESLTTTGPRLPAAIARRATASQRESGRVGESPANSATLVKARTGPKLPSAVVPLENVAKVGGGGESMNDGGQPSLLAIDPNTTPRPMESADPSAEAVGNETGHVVAAAEIESPNRQEGGLPVRIASALAPGGDRPDPVRVAGMPGRAARLEGEIVVAYTGATLARRTVSRPAIDGRVREMPTEAFQQREPDRRSVAARRHGSTEGSERAVEMGLDFLARHQFPDGHWSLDQFPDTDPAGNADAATGQMRADTAATGLALLSFLGAGYTHMDNKHRTVVRKAIDWLVANQQANGQLFTLATDSDRAARIYGHGIGSIALCEAYGMTRDPLLREPAAGAIRFILDAQHPTQGGWRYTKKDGATTWRKESDTSVSGWQLMALKSAQMAGLNVPADRMQKVGRWLDLAQAEGGTRYRYNPYAGDDPDQQRRGIVPNRAMTAEGLLMRMYLGWNRDHPALIAGADYLKANLPGMSAREASLRDAYYWYYATQVMFQMQGNHWTAWNGRMRPLLETSQVQKGPLAGSWHPNRPVPDRWAHAGGRLYVTTLNLLMLEVYYRYLPLFKTLTDDVAVGSEG